MKNWQITGIPVIMILGFLLMSGCTSTSPDTSTPQIVYVTELVTPTPTIPPVGTTIQAVTSVPVQTETDASVSTQLNNKWREIRVVHDTFNENKNRLNLKSDGDINELREKNIPYTISQYERIKNELLQITITNYDLKTERNILVSICDYKIKFLQGLSSYHHALQAETFSAGTSLTEYKNAKYLFQDERDIISVIPYLVKYWEYVNTDDQEARSYISSADQGISKMSNVVK
jgi:hypothetical protein